MDTAELAALYDAHASALFAFLLNLTRQEAEALDVLQETFLKLARQPELLREVREPRGFLIRLAHNLAIDRLRRHESRRRRHEALAPEASAIFAPAEDPDAQAFREALEAALGELPAEQRAVVHLRLWEDMTFEGIGALLGIPMNTAASRYRYGLDKLRERLRPVYDEIR
ncbi:MAG: sigma-70 family RNA polymerase sigma factor [Verrucomicrobia bacterium]|nr:sigma-70 family RNA polymerase sigma factor [Verrucomicrobiota bacterium]MBI3870346.1 sigma-70 family RNA polymerase sigma factor [Verrucomicrobiota bacterium]